MQYIDEKFKDCDPRETVSNIQIILKQLGLKCVECWNDSGIDNCHSVTVVLGEDVARTNGKGITKEFARASAYAEMLERLQSGMFMASYQSIIRDKQMDLHTFAPDGKYMTKEELIENGQWMDFIIDSYKEQKLTRDIIAKNCVAYACADDGKVLTIPFFSLFEEKYVYLPAAFVTRMYTANGNCAGNSKEEAWIHAMSEMMERHASQKRLIEGKALPQIPEEELQKFPTISKIMKQMRDSGDFDIAVFDYSLENNFPIVATRVINKRDQTYLVNIAADPVLEIAIQRTFTELFQGRGVKNLSPVHSCRILNKVTDFPIVSNVANQLHTGDGLYTADYFANELTCDGKPTQFEDNSDKKNKEILQYMLGLYKKLGKPVYVRNYSYLGFPSYKFVVPGFSETRALHLSDIIPEYALGDSVREVFKNAPAALDEDLSWMLIYSDSMIDLYGGYNSFSVNAGIPIKGDENRYLCSLTRAYSAYRLKKYKDAIKYTTHYMHYLKDDETKFYFACVNKYLQMIIDGIEKEKIRLILYKFFKKETVDLFYKKIDNGKTPYDDYVLRCEITNCEICIYKQSCRYHETKELIRIIGEKYCAFSKGQEPLEFVC